MDIGLVKLLGERFQHFAKLPNLFAGNLDYAIRNPETEASFVNQ